VHFISIKTRIIKDSQSIRQNGNFTVAAAATALCGSEVWLMKNKQVGKIQASEFKFLRTAKDETRSVKTKN
jgi:hypothetical protein